MLDYLALSYLVLGYLTLGYLVLDNFEVFFCCYVFVYVYVFVYALRVRNSLKSNGIERNSLDTRNI